MPVGTKNSVSIITCQENNGFKTATWNKEKHTWFEVWPTNHETAGTYTDAGSVGASKSRITKQNHGRTEPKLMHGNAWGEFWRAGECRRRTDGRSIRVHRRVDAREAVALRQARLLYLQLLAGRLQLLQLLLPPLDRLRGLLRRRLYTTPDPFQKPLEDISSYSSPGTS